MKQKLTIISAIILVSIAIFWACNDEELPTIANALSNKIELTLTQNSVTGSSVDLTCSVTNPDKISISEHGLCWNTSGNPTISDTKTEEGTLNSTSFNKNIESLNPSTDYYIKAYITFQGITIYSTQVKITTTDGLPSGITTTAISDITATTATSGGNITDDGGFEITARGVCWSTSTNPTITDSHTTDGTGTGSFTSSLTGLDVNTTYYVRSYATNETETVYGNEISFTTLDGLPSGITTTEVTDITATTATSGGNITDDGGFEITARGVCWSTSNEPTIADAHTTDDTGTGNFTSSLTGLDVNTTYYVRAYATNENGTSYGNELSFTTEDGLPSGITTTEVTDITATTATSGGNITDDGGFAITARGVCWSTSTEPTIAHTHTTDGTDTGSFTSSLTGLIEWSTYYVRAYATNNNGTTYGNEVSFVARNIIADYDGNIYGIVTIGSQTWMAENLKVTHYADGTAIPLVTDNSAWANLADNNTDDAYCYYNNDANSQYGALYTWAAAMNGAASSTANPSGVQGACPDGWHLPSDAEWTELVNFIAADGYSGTEGTALKSTTGWVSDGNGTDIYGFTALPGGYRTNSSGSFYSAGSDGFWWSSSELSSTLAFNRSLHSNNAEVSRGSSNKSYGFSVRCIKD